MYFVPTFPKTVLFHNCEGVKGYYSLSILVLHKFYGFDVIFECCKKSLTRLYHPSIHPSNHPTTLLFCMKNERLAIYCINLLIFCANHKTGEDLFILNSFKIFNANAQHFLFQTLFNCKIYNFLKQPKFNIFL